MRLKHINKSMRIKQIIEHEVFSKEEIGSAFSELEEFAKKNSQILSYTFDGKLKANQFVGVIETKSGFVLEILPKVAKENDYEKSKEIFLKMLKTLKNSPFKKLKNTNLKSLKNYPLLEVFIKLFIDEVDLIVKKGIKSSYIKKEENQNYLKGKLKLNRHLQKNFIHKERFFIEFEEYLPNIVYNQILKTTIKRLYKISKSFKNQQALREFLYIFDGVDEVKNIKSSFDKLVLNRTLKYYENALNLSKIFLLNQSLVPYRGKNIAFALLFDMNRLFEDFIAYYLKKNYKLNLKTQDKTHYLAYQNSSGKFRLIPDIIIDNGKIILDTKWKLIKNQKDISQSDIYQLYAYGTKYKSCNKLFLVYPKYSDIKIEKFDFGLEKDVELEILFFDLVNLKLEGFKKEDAFKYGIIK